MSKETEGGLTQDTVLVPIPIGLTMALSTLNPAEKRNVLTALNHTARSLHDWAQKAKSNPATEAQAVATQTVALLAGSVTRAMLAQIPAEASTEADQVSPAGTTPEGK
jgi:hypothetical protein